MNMHMRPPKSGSCSKTEHSKNNKNARDSSDPTEVGGFTRLVATGVTPPVAPPGDDAGFGDPDPWLLNNYAFEGHAGTPAGVGACSSDDHRRSDSWNRFKGMTTAVAVIVLAGLLSKRVAAKTRDRLNSMVIRGTKNPGSPKSGHS